MDQIASIKHGMEAVNTTFNLENFHFEVDGSIPLSNPSTVILVSISYVLFIKLLQCVFVPTRDVRKGSHVSRTTATSSLRMQPLECTWVVFVHNLILSIGSGILLVALVREMFSLYQRNSMLELFCDPDQVLTSGYHHFLFYINYMFKFYELFDTVLLAVRGKPIRFLHIYHHAITIVLSWAHLRGETCVQWVPLVCNLAVHVVMYGYYAVNAIGYRPWWKRYLTKMQICQFVCVLFISICVMAIRAFHTITYYILDRPYGYRCHCKDWYTVNFGVAVFASYLLLFLRMYDETYKKKNSKPTLKAS